MTDAPRPTHRRELEEIGRILEDGIDRALRLKAPPARAADDEQADAEHASLARPDGPAARGRRGGPESERSAD